MAFHQAGLGQRVLFVTLLAESHGKLLQHLRAFSFFNDKYMPDRMRVLSGYEQLAKNGPAGLIDDLARALRERQVRFMVIDGFRILHEFVRESPGEASLRLATFIHDLNALATAARCTTLLLVPQAGYSADSERTLVDGVIELGGRATDMRWTRELIVHKLRAAAQLPGRHTFKITDDGIRVFPRLEALVAARLRTPQELKGRVEFGIETLNAMIGGGLVEGSTTTVLGAAGAGKTLLGLNFLEAGTRRGEPAVYLGFFESPPRLLAKAASVSGSLDKPYAEGLLRMLWQPPLELHNDELAEKLLETLAASRARRLVIDGVAGFRHSAVYAGRVTRFVAALTNELRAMGVTTLISEELSLLSDSAVVDSPQLSAFVENIILLRYLEVRSQLYRLISIMKLRDSDYDSAIREFTITSRGIAVAANSESAETILSGGGRTVNAGSPAPATPPGARPARRTGRSG